MATIVLDPGHGGTDPGAVNGTRLEKDDNLRMALAVGQILAQNGHRVVYTRSDDRFVSLNDRNRISNNTNTDAFVSIHRNSSTSPTPNGVETYVRVNPTPIALRLATNVLGNVVRAGVHSNRGIHQRDFQVLRFTNAPAQLLELGFISNSEDNRLFDVNFDAYANAIAQGIMQEFGTRVVAPPITPPRLPASAPNVAPFPHPTPRSPIGRDEGVLSIQRRLNRDFGQMLAEDGLLGPLTRRALVRAYQIQLNNEFGAGLATDGTFGPLTRAATRLVRQGDRGNLVWILQAALWFHGFRTNLDGIFGPNTNQMVRAFQTSRWLAVDGIAGPNTFEALLRM